MRPLLSLEDVSFAYETNCVIDHVSLSLYQGDILCLLGPNGAGKSTLIKMLCGSLRPSAGHIALDQGLHTHQIGLVPQDIALYPWLTARENCHAFARLSGLGASAAREAASAALDLIEGMDVADVPVKRLSGGYRRRINIAAALVTRPRLLILDEPTVGIDLEARMQIAGLVKKLCGEGLSILLVSHDFAEADAIAQRLAFLSGGRLVACGDPATLVNREFGRAKRIEILLRAPPDEATRRALAQFGASPNSQDLYWQAFGEIDGWNADAIATQLTEAGVGFEEIRLRIPGAEALYGAFCTVGNPS